VIKKDNILARDLFTWLKASHPELCSDWTDQFERRFGNSMLRP
jgi:hypothetical protein